MIFLRTGLPGASKTLNSIREIIHSNDGSRPIYYTNIKLFLLDIEVACSFSGWYYGWYFPRLKDKSLKRKLIKLMKPIHDEGEFITADDVPWLRPQFEAHDHFDTWNYWVRRVYPKKTLAKLDQLIALSKDSQLDRFELIKPLNLHFTHFADPHDWYTLPKRSVILVDECQQFFPPRKVGSKVPQAIGELETHRHGGYDLHFITQDRTLCDANLRKLVGTHVHYFNAFGGNKVTRKQSAKCFDPNDYHDSKSATKKIINRDKKLYGVYWSAEIHTHKFKVPAAAYLALFFIALMVYTLYSFGSKMLWGEPETTPAQVQTQPVQQNKPVTTEAEITADNILVTLLKDVYISGTMTHITKQGRQIDYSFVRSTDEAVFTPDALGLVVEQVSPCLVQIRLGDTAQPVTCNPFYLREVVEPDDEQSESDALYVSAEQAERHQPKVSIF